jgi:predicted CXXCH cytochrome family protein
LLAALLAALSCAQEKEHKVLTFFFDGVPPLAPPSSAAQQAKTQPGMLPGAIAGRPAAQAGSVHGPTLDPAGCPVCHNPAASLAFVRPLNELCVSCHSDAPREFPRMHGPVAIGQCADCHDGHRSPRPHLLLKPVPQLCFQCHDRTPSGGQTFGCARPSDDANCMDCHNPHGGKARFFLVSRSPATAPGAKPPAVPATAPEGR